MSEEDYLFEIFIIENDFSNFVNDMEERVQLLTETKCMNCGHKGLEAISINESICNICQSIHNL